MQKRVIFCLIGRSKSGKTMLITEITRKLSHDVWAIRSTTTRMPRNQKDHSFYNFISRKKFEDKIRQGCFAEWIEYANNYCGYEYTALASVLAMKNGICAITEKGVLTLRRAGYVVIPIEIIPLRSTTRDAFYKKNLERIIADAGCENDSLSLRAKIINSFEPGGKEKAVHDLIAFITNYQQKARTVTSAAFFYFFFTPLTFS